MLSKRQLPARALSRTNRLVRRARTAIQLRKRNSPRRHRVHSVPPPRRRRRLWQIEKDLPIDIPRFVPGHSVRTVLAQLLHLDVGLALAALVLGGEEGPSGVEEVDAEEGAVLSSVSMFVQRRMGIGRLTASRKPRRSSRALACSIPYSAASHHCTLCSGTKAVPD